MREFFRGWRRKAGCVTLLMACAVLGLWMRGRIYSDLIEFRVASRTAIRVTHDGRSLCWMVLSESKNSPKRQFLKDSQGRIQATAEYLIDPHRNIDWDLGSKERPTGPEALYSLDWNEFRLGIAKGELGETRLLTLPYWSLAMPLALLSAYLLLTPVQKQPSTTSLPHV